MGMTRKPIYNVDGPGLLRPDSLTKKSREHTYPKIKRVHNNSLEREKSERWSLFLSHLHPPIRPPSLSLTPHLETLTLVHQ